LGYKVVEYNASDTRSISVLRGMIALGVRRLRKEVIVMDEVDGLSERGGTGELAAILKKTCVPIICIANEKPPKLRPIVSACVDIPFRRPMKSVIAAGLEKVAKAEGLRVSRVELEGLCESSGNDIRSILNRLEFYEGKEGERGGKDALLRMDLFSATQSLFRKKQASLDEAAGLVFVDYHMVPLMVQEGYLAACGDNLEAAAAAAEQLSFGDVLDRRIHSGQEWGLIPDFVQCSVAAARVAPGLAPFQIFPQWLGKNSKGLKHARYMRELGEKTGRRRGAEMRLDYVTPLQTMMFGPLGGEKADIKGVMARMDDLGWTRDDVMENLQEVCLDAMEVPTKVKTAFTREYNKMHGGSGKKKGSKKRSAVAMEGSASEDEEDEGVEEIEEGMEELEL
jgi:replication factor C subunit 1